MALQPIGGAAAIQPPTPPAGPKAKRKVVQGPDGTPHVVYVDLDTGQELQNLAGYHVIEQSNYADLDTLGLSPTGPEKVQETTAQKAISSVNPLHKTRGEKDSTTSGGSVSSRNPNNNFGYINQPGFMGIASAIPGPVGMAAKAAKVGMGVNNNAAINTARNMMGLPDQSLGSSIKGAVSDRKGHVADVNINGATYSVGLEAQDKRGMTTMTPDEAAKRAAANRVSINLATDDEIAQKEREFDAEFGKQKGIIGSFVSKATSFIDSLFGSRETEAEAKSRSMNSGSNFAPSRSGFADAIGYGGVGKAATSTPSNPVSGAARSTAGKVNRGSSGSSGGGSSGRSNPGTSGHMGAGGGTTSGHGPGIGSA